LHEAESPFLIVAGHPHPLTFYVEFALTNYREPEANKPLGVAVAEFVKMKSYEREQDLISQTHLIRIKRDLNHLQRYFPRANVAELTGNQLMGYFEADGVAHKTFNNCRGIVSSFLRFAHRGTGSRKIR
jgi:hypothetical protein